MSEMVLFAKGLLSAEVKGQLPDCLQSRSQSRQMTSYAVIAERNMSSHRPHSKTKMVV